MRARGYAVSLIVVAAAVVYPFLFPSSESTDVAFFTLVYVTLATAWNLIGGYAGYISLGHAAFFGIGAYTIAILANDYGMAGGYGLYALLIPAGAAAGLMALPLGFLALRLRLLHSFVIVTIAFLFMFQLLAANLIGVTGGSIGLNVPQPSWSPEFFNLPFYFAALLLALLTICMSAWVRGSRFGLGLLAIRDDEDKAAAVGVRTWDHKYLAYVLSAIPCGMAGALYAYFASYIYPQTVFDPLIDLAVVLSAFLGGSGTVLGPVIGALIFEPANQLLSLYAGISTWDLVLFGGVLLTVILLLPRGILPTVSARLNRRWVSRAVMETDAAPAAPAAGPPAAPAGGPE